MSRLDELIKELCPDGVVYKTLGEVATVIRGGNFQKKDFVENGKPCIHYGQMYTHFKNTTDKTLTFVSEEVFNKSKQAQPNDIVMAVTSENVDDVCSCVAWLGTENIAVSGHTAIIHHNQNPSYMSYYFHSEHFYKQKVKLAHGTKVIEVTPDKLLGIEIPVPPLPVQEEIVRILDTFTSLTAELTAELTARRKQYEYYRDALLTPPFEKKLPHGFEIPTESHSKKQENRRFSESVWQHKKLGEIATSVSSGKNKTKSEIGKYIVYGSTGAIAKCDEYVYDKEQILIARVGANAGFVYKVSGKYDVSDNTIIVNLKDGYNLQYVYYSLKNMNLHKYAKGGGQPLVTAGELKEVTIPLPPLDVQERIVNVLDNFDAICSDLKIGLPAEIEARKKQYEYYRDLLLTFASSGNTILTEQNRTEQNRTEQNRTEQNRTDEIKLLQYVFGYAVVRLGEIATYADTRIKAKDIISTDYVSVENLLQNKQGVNFTDKAPVGDSFIQYIEDDILIGNIRPYLKKIWKADRQGGTNSDVLTIRIKNDIKDIVSASYLYFQLSSEQFFNYDMQNAKGAKMPRGSKDAVMKYEIILPPLEEQERIVKILDRFDSLCNDISSGLPAEIEARQKQYEYYRDKLLQFTIKNA